MSSTSVAPEARRPPSPCGARRGCRPRARRPPRRCGTPIRSATAAAASACGTRWRPGVPLRSRARCPTARAAVNSVPARPWLDDRRRRARRRPVPRPKVHTSRRRELAHGGDARVVGVEDGQPVRRQRGRQLGLGLGDALDAPGALEVGRMDGQHDADLGLARSRRAARSRRSVYILISRTAASCVGVESKEGHRQPALGVEVARRCGACAAPRERTSAMISLAIVLPVEPVMPTTRTACRDRHQAARSPERASAIGRPRPAGPSQVRGERRRSARPARRRHRRARASATYAWPSARSPRKGDEERSGGDSARVDRRAARSRRRRCRRQAADRRRQHVRDARWRKPPMAVESIVITVAPPRRAAGPAGWRGSRAPGA